MLIAVLDSGIDRTHPDLAGQVMAPADVVGGGAGADPRGTGTHAAGVAAARTDNGAGIAGAAPGARLLSVRVLDEAGRASAEQVVTALATAADAGAGVIALTLGGDAQNLALVGDPAVRSALRAATAAGSVLVVGDGGADLATDRGVVVVGDGRGPASGPGVVTVTGGGDVLGTTPLAPTATWPRGTDGYGGRAGLGPATALAAGAAALLVAQGLTPEEVADLLLGTARNTGDPRLGAGTLDAAAAVEQAGAVGAGGRVLPGTGEGDGGLPPALVGGLAVGAAVLAVGATVALAGRRPRPR